MKSVEVFKYLLCVHARANKGSETTLVAGFNTLALAIEAFQNIVITPTSHTQSPQFFLYASNGKTEIEKWTVIKMRVV